MTGESDQEFAVTFPANARITGLTFGAGVLEVSFEDGGDDRVVRAASIAAIHGASIRRETMLPDTSRPVSLMDKVMGNDRMEVQEAMQHVFAIRETGVGELLYLVADTFNFRSALGADTALLQDANFRSLVRRLAAFAPNAVQDAFVAALLAGSPLPPPVDGLLEFLRIASR